MNRAGYYKRRAARGQSSVQVWLPSEAMTRLSALAAALGTTRGGALEYLIAEAARKRQNLNA